MQMEHQQWQPVPGLEDGIIFPYIRKPDVISSNSYIIAYPGQILLIDPGGLPEQAAILAEEIRRQISAEERPVFVCLTHSHLDHCLQLMHTTEFQDPGPVCIVSHEKAAEALEGQDPRATTADLMGHEMTSLVVAGRLFCRDSRSNVPFPVQKSRQIQCTLTSSLQPIRPEVDLWCQMITCQGTPGIACYHTPGHSPDSICFKVGRLLFCGDILFATNPGVAGLFGWDHRELLASVDKLLWLLDHGDIQYCCPGHGRILDADTTRKALKGIRKDAASLAGIKPITPERVHMMAAYAADIMAEVDRLFTIVAGRLFFVSHVLEELEEEGEAERLRGLIDADTVDGLLAEFNRFSEGYHANSRREIHVALKAGQITAKLARCIDQGCLAEVIDPSFILRAMHLIEDYSLTFRGFEPLSSLGPESPAEVIQREIENVHRSPFEDDAILLADDDEAYLRALIARISHVNPLERMDCSLNGERGVLCLMDRNRFRDLFRSILERCSQAGISRMVIRLAERDDRVLIFLNAPGAPVSTIYSETGDRFITRSALLSGGSIRAGDTGKGDPMILEFPAYTLG